MFVRCAQHKINWIAARRLRSLAMTLFCACVACGLTSLPQPSRTARFHCKRSEAIQKIKIVRHWRTHSLLSALCALLSNTRPVCVIFLFLQNVRGLLQPISGPALRACSNHKLGAGTFAICVPRALNDSCFLRA